MHHASSLIIKYLEQTLSPSERLELEAWCNEKPEHRELFDSLTGGSLQVELQESAAVKDRIWNKITGQVPVETPVVKISRWRWPRLVAAASIILLFGIGYWFYSQRTTINVQPIVADVKAPSSIRARITLADGSTVSLDSANAGLIATQNGTRVQKNAKGEVIYQSTAGDQPVVYNTLSNPRGSKPITLTLSDGSQVWLNAESAVTYPVAFTGGERKVEITGEAYFEVAHDATKPFYVTKGRMEVKVLGTHFNVNAYDDEAAVKVTLLEGSVKVSADQESVTIKPGQQAAVGDRINVNGDIDLEQVMAWKNGLFSFDRADLKTVMRELARWYDVKVSFEKQVPTLEFGGKMGRDLNLSQVLHLLEKNEVHFRVEGNTIKVIP